MADIALRIDTPSPRANTYSVDVSLDVWPAGVPDMHAYTKVQVIGENYEVLANIEARMVYVDNGIDPYIKQIYFSGSYVAGGTLDGTKVLDSEDVDMAPYMDYEYKSLFDGEGLHTYRLILSRSPVQDWIGDDTVSGDDQVGTAFRFTILDVSSGKSTFVRDVFIEGVYSGECLVNPKCGLYSPYDVSYNAPTWRNFLWDGEHMTRVRPVYGDIQGAALYRWFPNDGSFDTHDIVIASPYEDQTWDADDNDHRMIYGTKDVGLTAVYYIQLGELAIRTDPNPEVDPATFYTSIQTRVWDGRATIYTNNIIASNSVNTVQVTVELYRNDEVIALEEFVLSNTNYHISTLTVPNIPVYGGDLFYVNVRADGDWGSGHLYTVTDGGYNLSFLPLERNSEFGSIAGFNGIETATSRVRTNDESTVMIDYYGYKHDAPKKVRADKVLELSGNNPVEYHGPIVTTRNNTGFLFGGQTSLTLDCDEVLGLTDSWSLELWAMMDSYYRPAYMKFVLSADAGFWMKTGDESTDEIIAGFWDGSTSHTVTHSNEFLFDDRWHHFAMTYDSTTLRLYVDGELVETLTVSASIVFDSSLITIGENFVGGLDDLAIYDYALSADRVISRYLIPRGK